MNLIKKMLNDGCIEDSNEVYNQAFEQIIGDDGVEENGEGIKQLNTEELIEKGIKDPEKLLGTDNAFIKYESKDKDGNAITKQHLVNSKLESNERVTNITTDAQDLNGDQVIDKEELPSNDNQPLEKIIGNFGNTQSWYCFGLSCR